MRQKTLQRASARLGRIAAVAAAIIVALGSVATLGWAHEGHDHGETAPLTMPVAPRVVALTPDYELVGVRSRDQRLTLFLTRYASNEPVDSATLTIEANGQRAEAAAQGDGIFEISAPWLASATPIDLTFHLTDGDAQDLLTGRLEPPQSASAQAPPTPTSRWPQASSIFVFVAGILLGLAATRLLRRPPTAAPDTAAPATETTGNERRLRRVAGALAVLASFAFVDAARAADAATNPDLPSIPATMTTDLAQRLPDGTLFVPKATQHLLSVRTLVVAASDAAVTRELPGTVIASPGGFGRVQPPHSGRLEAPEDGIGYVGRRVAKGDLLAYLMPHIDVIERGNVQSQIAEAAARIAAQEAKLARLRAAPLAVPPLKIDEAEGELAALQERRRQLAPSLVHRSEIRAPVSGIISKAGSYAGQIVEPRDTLFEIVDPAEYWVEAAAFDAPDAADLEAATAVLPGGNPRPLEFVGRGLALKQQAAPLMFKVNGPTDGLSIGQPLSVVLQSRTKVAGFVIPAASVVRRENGLATVWVKVEPERFAPLTVKVAALDGDHVVVTAGLKPGLRVVTEGASLLNQVR